MKLTLLCKGDGYHFPPCYMLQICGFHILLECPIDLSALKVFSPISCQPPDAETAPKSDDREIKRRKFDNKPIEEKDLIHAEPWFKTVANLHLWDLSFLDIVLISSPMGLLGLPFLTRNKKFSAKVYATEATMRIGKLMMEDIVSMHMEYKQFYGPDGSGSPEWIKWNELELLPNALKEIVMGEDGAMLGGWQPLYSAKDVKDCMQKLEILKYAEENCYNDTLLLKAFSSGLEIGACNWIINGPRKSITYLSSSMFESAHAMNFEYHSLCGNDIVLFSDFSFSDGAVGPGDDASRGDLVEEEQLINTGESSDELDKLAFICSCAIESLQLGGSVLIPCGRIGLILQLLEQISIFLESSNLEVPIFMISTVAEEMLAYTNIIPEWLCKQRQENLYSGESLFGHVELIKRRKLQLFPAIHSIDLITSWQEPCIVFAPHWSLRLGPVVHLLRRWHADPNSLLVLEQEVDASLALLPFKPLEIKVLQCSFLSGIKTQKIQPLLEILRPKLVLFPENPRVKLQSSSDSTPYTILHYSEGQTLRVPSLRSDIEVKLATDLAVQLRVVMMKEENLALARLKGKLVIDHGTFRFGSSTREITVQRSAAVDPNQVLSALCEKGVNGTINQDGGVIDVREPGQGSIEMYEKHTVVSADDEILASLLFEVVSSILGTL